MAVPYPAGLPLVNLLASNSLTLGQNLVEFNADEGRAITRPRHTEDDDHLVFDRTFTLAQKNTFETFYKTTLARGALSFTQVDSETTLVHEFKMKSPPNITKIGPDAYRISFSVDRRAA